MNSVGNRPPIWESGLQTNPCTDSYRPCAKHSTNILTENCCSSVATGNCLCDTSKKSIQAKTSLKPVVLLIRPKIRSGGVEVRKPWQRGEETKVERQKRQRKKRNRKKTKEERQRQKKKLKKALVFSPETPPTQLKKTKFQDDTETPKEHQSNCEKGEG